MGCKMLDQKPKDNGINQGIYNNTCGQKILSYWRVVRTMPLTCVKLTLSTGVMTCE